MTKIGINGFGRIGRLVFPAICDQCLLGKEIDVVALNDLVPADNLAYLLKYDSTQGAFKGEVNSSKSSEAQNCQDDLLIVNGHRIKCLAVKEGPSALPWKQKLHRGKPSNLDREILIPSGYKEARKKVFPACVRRTPYCGMSEMVEGPNQLQSRTVMQ